LYHRIRNGGGAMECPHQTTNNGSIRVRVAPTSQCLSQRLAEWSAPHEMAEGVRKRDFGEPGIWMARVGITSSYRM
jgi:hypothetical protein